MRKSWIIVDLDGTLADCAHRAHLAQAKQWDEFHAGIPDDKPIKATVEFLWRMNNSYEVLLCTGRNEAQREATKRWLYSYNLSHLVDGLLMRPDEDRSSDHELKPKLVYEFFGDKETALEAVLLVLDDRDKVVEAWRNEGFTCWQVAAGNY